MIRYKIKVDTLVLIGEGNTDEESILNLTDSLERVLTPEININHLHFILGIISGYNTCILTGYVPINFNIARNRDSNFSREEI